MTDNNFQNILKLYDFKTYESAYFDSKSYKNLRTFLIDNLPKQNIEFPNIKICSYPTIKQIGKEIVKKHTNGINLEVPYTFEDELKSTIITKFGQTPDENNIDEIISYIKQNIEYKNITDIPVFTNLSAPKNGSITTEQFYDDFENPAYYEKLPIIIKAISLQGKSDDFAKGIYVHEMYHGLSERNKGYTNNYLYNETLPIFMEEVAALDIDESLITPAILQRIINLKIDILNLTYNTFTEEKGLNITEPQKYILSFLLATNLFNIYMHSSNKGKKEIDNEINKILIGKQKLEDVLNKYEITPEKGANIVKRKIKTLK